MFKRKCECCGTDISFRPSHHYFCYSCWQSVNGYNFNNDDDYPYECHRYDYLDDDRDYSYNDTYEQRYKGDSEYDMGPDWDYDEFPPENL